LVGLYWQFAMMVVVSLQGGSEEERHWQWRLDELEVWGRDNRHATSIFGLSLVAPMLCFNPWALNVVWRL